MTQIDIDRHLYEELNAKPHYPNTSILEAESAPLSYKRNWSPSIVVVHSAAKVRSLREAGFFSICLACSRLSARFTVSGLPRPARMFTST